MADVTRADVETLIQEEYSNELLQTATASSAVLSTVKKVPLGTKVTNMPVLTSLPKASWVTESSTDETGRKKSSKATWGNKRFVVEEIAVIVPIHEDVLEDSTEDLLKSLTELGGQAIGAVLDAAVLFGVDKPATWTDPDMFTMATTDGSLFQEGAGKDDLAGSLLQAAGRVAKNGGSPSVALSDGSLKWELANLRDANGSPVFIPSLNAGLGQDNLYGMNAGFVQNGAWDSTKAKAFVVDKDRVLIGIRKDVTVKFLDQATVDGINLAERDMVALRFKARYAYAVGNVMNASGEKFTPVAAVIPAAPVVGA